MPENLLVENQMLRARMDDLLQQAAHNHQIMRRHQAFDLEIVGAGNFGELIKSIFQTLPASSELDAVSLTLVDQGADIRTVMTNLGINFGDFPNLLFVESETKLSVTAAPTYRPAMGPFHESLHRAMFPQTASTPASVAIVPLLRNKRLIGTLNLGSFDATRFTPSLGTDFVEHMASIIAICLENVISNEFLKYIGLTDPLTGVYNRRYIDRRLLEEIGRARRQEYGLSCMYIDIDHFKNVNDTFGHPGGDEVLCEVATRIKAELRLSDAMGRYGGEEFVALLIAAKPDDAMLVAERIRASVANTPFQLDSGEVLNVTVSIGIASFADTDRTESIEAAAQHFVAKADHALYEAKESGRNRVVSYD